MSEGAIVSIAVALIGALGLLGVALANKRPAKVTPAEEMNSLRADMADCKHDLRIVTDYVHDLREHIVKGLPPPPPDFPSDMRL